MLHAFRPILIVVALLVGTSAHAADLPLPESPDISAHSHILINYRSGQELAGHKPDERVEPASITKMMTAYVIFDEIKAGHLKPSDKVSISEKAWRTPGSKMFLSPGKKVTVDELLHGLMTISGNDAAVALAEHVGGTTESFVDYMNQYAKQIGLKNSHFMDVSGLPDDDHYMSARDIATLYAAILRNFPEQYDKYFHEKEFSYAGIRQFNRNTLLWSDPRVDGGKTGHTESAGYNLTASAKDKGMRLISVVIGASSENDRKGQTSALFNYGFRFYQQDKIFGKDKAITKLRLWKGEDSEMPVVAKGPVYLAYPQGKRQSLKISAELPHDLTAPVKKGKRLGKLIIKYNDKTLKEEPLYAGKTIEEGGMISRFIDSIRMKF